MTAVLTHAQRLQVLSELRLLVQDPQHVGGLHALQLHLPVDVDLVVEADVDEAGAVFTLLTGVLTCRHTHTDYTLTLRLSWLLVCVAVLNPASEKLISSALHARKHTSGVESATSRSLVSLIHLLLHMSH